MSDSQQYLGRIHIEVMTSLLRVFIFVALTVLIADFLWLGYIATPLYTGMRKALNPNIRLPFRLLPAILAYSAMIVSIVYLVVPNITPARNLMTRITKSLLWGMIWGIGVYGTYNMTNLAIIDSYPSHVAVIDTLWGVVIGALAGFVGSYANA